MNRDTYNNNALITVQRYSWYVALVYFSITVIVSFFDSQLSERLTYIGIIGVIGVTIVKLIVMAENFRRHKFIRYWLLSYGLVLILAITIGVKLFLWT